MIEESTSEVIELDIKQIITHCSSERACQIFLLHLKVTTSCICERVSVNFENKLEFLIILKM